MSDPNAQPIMVDASATPAQVQAGIRQLILSLSAAASALGFSHVAGQLDLALQFVGPIAWTLVFVLGQLHTRSQAKKLAITADAAPAEVAQIKAP